MPSFSETSISRKPSVPGPARTRGRNRCRSQSASKMAMRSTVITRLRRSAAISRIRSGSCSACRVRAASTRKRAKPRSSSVVTPAAGSGAISIGALSVSPRSRNTRTSRRWNHATGHDLVHGLSEISLDDQGMGEMGPTPYWTPSSATADAVALVSMPRATIRPPSRATYTRRPRDAPWRPRSHSGLGRTDESRKTKSGRRSAISRLIERWAGAPRQPRAGSRGREVPERRRSPRRRGRRRSRSGRSRQARRDSLRGAVPARRGRDPPPR